MDEKNQIIEALGKVPELVAAAEKSLEACEDFKKMLAERALHADIPEEEVKKVTYATAQTVSRTRCAPPDTTDLAQQIADKAIASMRPVIKAETEQGVKDTMKETPVIVTHEHVYYPTHEIVKVADKKLVQRFWVIAIVAALSLSYIITDTCLYFNSLTCIGKEYAEIYRSKYTTDEERTMLAKDIYDTGFLPREYAKTPDLVKAKNKRNKEILRQRKMEAKANKGKFSTKVPLEW